MGNEEQNLIEFHSGAPGLTDPRPFRATQAAVPWLKQQPAEVTGADGKPISTLKRCMPFMDAMTCGYIIPLRTDVRFTMRGGHLHVEHLGPEQGVMEQPEPALRGTPLSQMLILKFVNGWIVKTPPGYSTLFLPLLNQFTVPFQILAGLVETDSYYAEVHFPALCLMKPDSEYLMEKGTPLVQAIPFKRESWRSEFAPSDPARREQSTASLAANAHVYRDENWVKKDFR
jgi:hypothetical protein